MSGDVLSVKVGVWQGEHILLASNESGTGMLLKLLQNTEEPLTVRAVLTLRNSYFRDML